MKSLRGRFFGLGLPLSVEKVLRALEVFFVTPLMIHTWGAHNYGEWLLIASFPAILGLSELGLGTSGGNEFVLNYERGNLRVAWSTWRTCIAGLAIVGGIILCVTLVILSLPEMGVWVSQKSGFRQVGWIPVLLVLSVSRVVWFFIDPIDALWRTSGRAVASRWMIALLLAGKVILWPALLFWCLAKPLTLALSEACWTISGCLVYLGIGYATHAGDAYRTGSWMDLRALVELVKRGFGYLLTPVWQSIHFQGMLWVVKALSGAETVAAFGAARSITRSVTQLSSIIGGMHFPELQSCVGRRNLLAARHLFSRLVAISTLAAVVAFPIIGIGGASLLNKWLKGAGILPPMAWWILVLASCVSAVWWSASTISRAFNRPWSLSIAGTLTASAMLLFGLLAGRQWGVTGVAFGCLAFESIMLCIVMLIAGRWLPKSKQESLSCKSSVELESEPRIPKGS